MRPVHRMVAHSAFIIVARRLASHSQAGAEPLPPPAEVPALDDGAAVADASDSYEDAGDSDDDDRR